ncbi:Fic/DOC family protein [Aliidiomarina maris]|uniref:Cell filamentation protein n=1 Tax=Aliidiomarina maris TaxID=531312 RepID=A0A327WV45_9GAMM|nr:Fic family protein [Aliidiomarina maris]RAJ95325.1 cell filamentation protein [Aliidiomarina maris]RUO22781.1 cell filamentation protein Fic [Aliidiomarina maris]
MAKATRSADQADSLHEQVLNNKLSITAPDDINDAELFLLHKLYKHLFLPELTVSKLQFSDIRNWHQWWFSTLYTWAGELRDVQMSKGGFPFATPQAFTKEIPRFETQYLNAFPLLPSLPEDEFIQLLARCHVDFVLLHPFRDGNGRIARLLLDVMAVKAGYTPLDYTLWNDNKVFYFKSIQAGVAGESQHLERLIRDALPQRQ